MNPISETYRHLRRIGGFILGLLLTGILGYHWIEGWSFLDSSYMTVITLSTVGYGEVHSLTAGGRVFTMILILFGIASLTYALSTVTAFIVEGELKDVLRRSRMQSKIDAMSGHHILCGGGHTGQVILEELLKTSRRVVVIERSEEAFKILLDRQIPALLGDATRDETLKRAGIERAVGLFAAIGADRDNAFVALTARGLNPGLRIVAEQVEEGVRDKLLRSGADAVVRPSRIGGMRMASEMVRPTVVSFLDAMLREDRDVFRIEEISVPSGSSWAGKPVGQIKGGQGDAALVVAIKKEKDGQYLFNPPASHPITPGEVLVVMGTVVQQADLLKRLAG